MVDVWSNKELFDNMIINPYYFIKNNSIKTFKFIKSLFVSRSTKKRFVTSMVMKKKLNEKENKINECIRNMRLNLMVHRSINKYKDSYLSKTEGVIIKSPPPVAFKALASNIAGYCKKEESLSIHMHNGDVVGIETNKEYNIVINSKLKNMADIEETIEHEMAHYIDFQQRGFSCHDEYWQRIYESISDNAEHYLDSHKNN